MPLEISAEPSDVAQSVELGGAGASEMVPASLRAERPSGRSRSEAVAESVEDAEAIAEPAAMPAAAGGTRDRRVRQNREDRRPETIALRAAEESLVVAEVAENHRRAIPAEAGQRNRG